MTKNITMAVNPVKSTILTVNNTILTNVINKINQDILTQDESEYLSKIAKENQRGLISYFNNETGFGLKKINIVENNEIFEKLLIGINLFKTANPNIKIEYIFDALVVSKNNRIEATLHNVIKISLKCGSYIKVSSATGNSLEISVIRVNKNKMRNGKGTQLMNIMFDFCYSQLEFRPRFILECTGCLKSQGYSTSIGIKEQTCFFRRFGFRVENNKHYPHYVMMSSPKLINNLNEHPFQLAA
jgi:hypothetical protein